MSRYYFYLVEVDETDGCKLLGWFGWVLQFTLGVMIFLSLVIKWRYFEKIKRSFKEWFMDSFKQGLGLFSTHFFNVFSAYLLGHEGEQEDSDVAASPDQADSCNWYFMNLIGDVFIGTFFNILIYQGIIYVCSKVDCMKFESGHYEDGHKIRSWLYQIFLWILAVYIGKVIVLCFFVLWQDQLASFTNMLFYPLDSQPQLKLVVVMIIIPTLLNSLQFWIQDNFLKNKIPDHIRHSASSRHLLEDEPEPSPGKFERSSSRRFSRKLSRKPSRRMSNEWV